MSAVVAEHRGGNADTAPLTGWQRFKATFLANRLAVGAAIYLVAIVGIGFLGPALAPHDPIEVDLARAFEGPSSEHWLGTDHLGRSTSARTIAATGVALKAAALGVGIAIVLGAPVSYTHLTLPTSG